MGMGTGGEVEVLGGLGLDARERKRKEKSCREGPFEVCVSGRYIYMNIGKGFFGGQTA